MDPEPIENVLFTKASTRPPLVMGILNLTPDSFSDGGQFSDPAGAIAAAELMVAGGADVIDVGGESTRPGSVAVPSAEQIRRVVPVIAALAQRLPRLTVSVDTSRADVAAAAIDAGARIVNDIWAGRDDPKLLPLVASRGVAVILMHMQGSPATMQLNPIYSDVVAEVLAFLQDRIIAAEKAGIDRKDILVDPGIGFGKSVSHNLEILRRLSRITAIGRPVVIGTSRKGFIGKVLDAPDPAQRSYGTAATVTLAVASGVAMVRVHDVKAMAQVVRMTHAIINEEADVGKKL